jgi:hypothetical protein
LTETMPTPGTETLAPVFENGATTSPCDPCPSAPTELMPSDTAGGLTAISKSGFSSFCSPCRRQRG